MKKLTFLTMAIVALLFTSCTKTDYKSFIGTWGVEKIEYYNIDYAGNPIAASMETHIFDPNDADNGIQLVFRENKTGEMRDSAIDTLIFDNDDDGVYETSIYCPDTVIVYTFSYSYDKSDHSLYMNMNYGDKIRTFKMTIENMTDNSFIYENEYDLDYMERAYLKRLSKTPSKSANRQIVKHPHKRGSLLGDR